MKKKSLLLALLVLTPLGFSACGQGEEDPISVSIRDDRQFFIPASTVSCKSRRIKTDPEDDVTSSYFKFQDVTFSWSDTKTNAYISYIQVEYTTSDVDLTVKKCKIGGDDLLAMSDAWWQFGRPIVGGLPVKKDDGTIYTPTQTVRISGCGMVCGGISISDTPFISYGTVKVVGYKEDESGQRIPISTTTAITLENR
jgi:hypothetical protein